MRSLIASYLCLMVAGLLWGAREKVHQNGAVFQNKFPQLAIEDVSFFGPKMDCMKYADCETKQYRNPVLKIFPYNDFWHLSWYAITFLRFAGIWLAFQTGAFRKSKYCVVWVLLWVIAVPAFWGGVSFWWLGKI